jgi:hypothetical protein
MRIRRTIANIPLIGRYILPEANRKSIFALPGDYYPGAHTYPLEAFGQNHKIVVFGLPKSGNTWVISLLSDYLNLPPVHLHEDRNKCGVTAEHNHLTYAIKIRRDLSRGVYVLRDIRDIVVSFYYFARTDFFKELNDPYFKEDGIETFYYRYFLHKLVPRYGMMTHAEKYSMHGVPVIQYERLWDNPVNTFSGLLHRMGLPVDKQKVVQAVEKNTLQKLQKEGKQLWQQFPATHFRKGGYGSYKQELPDDIIDDINFRFKRFLDRWGYSARY